MLHTWVEEDSACAFRADLCGCLADGEAYCGLHMTNLSVTLQESALQDAGGDSDWVVLQWISSITFMLICGSDVLVCSAFRAWWFGCIHPLLLEDRDVSVDEDMNEECWAFWRILGCKGEQLGQCLTDHYCVHILLVTQEVDRLFLMLADTLLHLHTALSLHVSE